MAVVTLYMSDRDDSKTFTDKKSADEYDKMLELAENVSAWVEQNIDDLSESQTEALGMLVATNKDLLAKAIKGKPELLLSETTSSSEKDDDNSNVTSMAANQ
ncbi:MAG: YebG family protein [Gammaproteobacteria bacterium]|nr:YebG family protein [Gammaproteobacteria bacterium]